MGKKINLPLLPSVFDKAKGSSTAPSNGKKPTLETARSRLGGRATGDAPPVGMLPGTIVNFEGASGMTRTGVVVFASSTEVLVLLDDVRLKRLAPSAVTLKDGDPPGELAGLATDARVFGMLAEGQAVRYAIEDATALAVGKLIEKCRYGGLVARGDGTVLAVGFRKLWPALASEPM